MSGGFGAGFIKGMALSVMVAGVLSLVSPLSPKDPASSSQVNLTTPAGSGFNAARDDTNPVLPNTDQRVVKESAPKPEPRQASPSAPVADTLPALRPAAIAGGIEQKKVSAGDTSLALAVPSAVDRPVPRPAALGVPMPKIDNPVANIPSNEMPAPDAPNVPQIATPPVMNETAPPPNTAPKTSTLASQSAANPAKPVAPDVSMPPEIMLSVPRSDPAAIRRNRVVFENPDNKPLFSIILIDVGKEGLANEVLRSFTFPVTYALDPSAAGATADAKFLSQGGFEILSLPPSKGADITSESLNQAFAKLPESVGLVDWPNAGIQASAKQSDQVVATLLKTGHGLVTYDIGQDGADQKARHGGVFSAKIYRILDAERESGVVIKRYLNRAVLEAGKTGKVIVIGHTYPETVTALFSWALSSKSASVVLAPISAALLTQ